MSKYCRLFCVVLLPLICFTQNKNNISGLKSIVNMSIVELKELSFDDFQKMDSLQIIEVTSRIWYYDLTEKGVRIEGDTMYFNEEARRLIADENYRKSIYEGGYNLENLKTYLLEMKLKIAFWQMINLYPKDKKNMLTYVYAYDKTIPSDEVLLSSFYTYAFFDPEIAIINNGKPKVLRPDLFEKKFRWTKEMIYAVTEQRKKDKKDKP